MLSETTRSPLILSISWGRTDVEDLGPGKDVKLYPGGGRPWDWSETGTRHSPGIQPADVEELLAHGATMLPGGSAAWDAIAQAHDSAWNDNIKQLIAYGH